MSIWRPQFAYPTPDGCTDEDFIYVFDGSNTPLLNQDISNKTLTNIPLILDRDWPFYWRGWKVGAIRETTSNLPNQYEIPNLSLQLQDCYLNNLSDGPVAAVLSGFPQNPLQLFNKHSVLSGPPVSLEPELYCPPGGYILVTTLTAPLLGGAGVNRYFASFTLYGVKRLKACA